MARAPKKAPSPTETNEAEGDGTETTPEAAEAPQHSGGHLAYLNLVGYHRPGRAPQAPDAPVPGTEVEILEDADAKREGVPG